MHSLKRTFLLAGATTLAASAAYGQTLIADDFEVDSSANYADVDDGTPDGTTTFAFDYIAVGIPLAPNSMPGDTGGLRLTANDSLGASDARTVFHNTVVDKDAYRLTVDVYMNFQGAAGSTEYANIGVAGDGATTNSVFLPISGSGSFISFTGDGGSGSDYRWFRDAANTPAGETDNTTLPNSHPSYMGNASNGTGAFYQSLFPSPPATIAGSPGNIWTTVTIDVDNLAGTIQYSFDGTLTFDGLFGGRFDGLVSLGIADVFSSISGSNNFTLYDNLVVEEILPPSVGTAFCPSNPNSTGVAANIEARGSVTATDNDLLLRATDLPAGQFGIFVVSPVVGAPVQPANSNGLLCLTGPIGRYTMPGQILQANASGVFALALDLTMTPTPNSLVAVTAGDTYSFQAWFRDGPTSSNFTSGVTVNFQ